MNRCLPCGRTVLAAPAWGLGLAAAGWCDVRLLTAAWATARRTSGTAAFADLLTVAAQLTLAAALTWLALATVACVLAESDRWWARSADRAATALTPPCVRTVVRLACGLAVAGPLGVPLATAPAGASETLSSCDSSRCGALAGLPLPDRPDALVAGSRPGRASATRFSTSAVSSEPAAPLHTLVVRPGDSLWSLAAAELPHDAGPAEIAAEWPRWFEVNRRAIGDDPDLIHPGTRLVVPTASSSTDPDR